MADLEAEYESDPEDVLRPSVMRRREASDDEEGEGSCGEGESRPVRKYRPGIGSDDELEGQGGAPGYDDEEYEDQEEEEELLEEEVEEGLEDADKTGFADRMVLEGGRGRDAGEFDGSGIQEEESGLRSGGGLEAFTERNQVEEEEKKEAEPYAVPTAGAFYMHDDRFQEKGRGRQRRMPGGRRLWESKDERAWVHDRFEEMNLQDGRYEEKRMSKGRFRGRGGGRSRGSSRGFGRGNRQRAYYDDSSVQNRVLKSVRGRGPRRYEALTKNSEVLPIQLKQSSVPRSPMANNSTVRQFSQIPDTAPEVVAPRKQAFASSLSSASPPFYPSCSSNPDISAVQKCDVQTGSHNKAPSSITQMENVFPVPKSGNFLRGKGVAEAIGFDRLYLDDSVHQVPGKPSASPTLQAPGSSLLLSNANKSPTFHPQGRTLSTTSLPSQPVSFNQVAKAPLPNQSSVVQQKSLQNQGQSSLRIATQQLNHGNQVAPAPHTSLEDSSEGWDTESPPGTSKSKTSFVGKVKVGNQGAGRGSMVYGGAQVIGPAGPVGLSPGDQNFAGTRALLPVMQFGGQHPGGLGVPAVGMALPGYVAQPGFGNSEMTWVPVLAGAAGALGAPYCSPYIAFDGSYYARPSGQASTSISSMKESNGAKSASSSKPAQKDVIVNDEFGQRQNKPRRYSEMNFGQ
ncbi:hypothetical protein HPP92_009103 [Vanilla planifolia]|uniref:Btz domain-containing protein n=1 Tax=Vanilla planifolia TaxID=51239 RepID=A0A835RA03_VANPL|nr:hypothetical protein HPP92_009103 [Vanilla planifolia]